jgi:hypothetical protein
VSRRREKKGNSYRNSKGKLIFLEKKIKADLELDQEIYKWENYSYETSKAVIRDSGFNNSGRLYKSSIPG